MKRNIIDIHKLTYFLFIIDRHSHCPEYKFASEDRKKIITVMYLIFAMSFLLYLFFSLVHKLWQKNSAFN